MKTIGIAGITAEGASLCYKTVCSHAGGILGLYKHPPVLLHNPSFSDIFDAQQRDDWKTVADIVSDSVSKLAIAGADFAIIPGNSVHFVLDDIRARSTIPVVSIVDTAVAACKTRGYRKVAVLGVGLTMSRGLYSPALQQAGIAEMPVPLHDQEVISRIIYDQIVPGNVTGQARSVLLALAESYKTAGCDALLLACTELPIVITDDVSPLPTVDTTRLLAIEAVRLALQPD